ncbi:MULTISPECIES: methionine--tRNA ligase subunit beta [Acidiplasma]|jgi:methionine--tRNA ligase beta chain|uniref:Methionine--tRNA ligase n=2 Tax=Acidiplasma TaxID=507753 RepID=A0A0Q0VVZ0_9ARCH|nr:MULTISPECIES: methionine--tRNA ligase subunit beta [Acidiplasma]KJE49176.1 methionyl-tRNA synthetase [Acidiplasma sp. MBA-1]KPV47195.1 methionyl-tRNA synthetase [Acidiplasma aeolicum]KQB35800.1 methionyl-tRNA synthetase [Acidiplasma cupricumulans]KQB35999.1 methionyl-tRNA synthetase [Acidiplasma aeolicum]WMT54877.1 MAG: methionine--tRNA ligase subunit beta [Acidiplasma sp.]
MDKISIDYFHNIDLRVGKVIECEKVEKSRSLLKIIVDLGDEKKQIISSIYEYYKPEEMIGKQLVIINNLEPAKFMGLESQGMLLAVEDDKGVSLLTPDREVERGSKVH